MEKLKTLKQVKEDNKHRKALISAVIRQLGGFDKGQISDIMNYGISGGFGGFIYYNETHKFAMKNRKQIIEMLGQQAEELGEDVVLMVSHFGVFRNSPMDKEDRTELYKYLGGGRCEQSTITNVMAWYAAEEVARMFEDC